MKSHHQSLLFQTQKPENGFASTIMNTSRTDLVEARMTEVDERYALRRSDG